MRLTFSHIMNFFLVTMIRKWKHRNKETNLRGNQSLRLAFCGKVKRNMSSRKRQFFCCRIQKDLANTFWRLLDPGRDKKLTKFLSFATFVNLSSCDFLRHQDTDKFLPRGTERGSVPMIGGMVSARTMESSALFNDDPTILIMVWKGTWRVSNFPS